MYLAFKNQNTHVVNIGPRYLKSCSNGFSEKNMQVLLKMLILYVYMYVCMYACMSPLSEERKREINHGLPGENQSVRAGKRNLWVGFYPDFSKTKVLLSVTITQNVDRHLECTVQETPQEATIPSQSLLHWEWAMQKNADSILFSMRPVDRWAAISS